MSKEYLKRVLEEMFNTHQEKKTQRLINEGVPFYRIVHELQQDRNFFYKEVLNG